VCLNNVKVMYKLLLVFSFPDTLYTHRSGRVLSLDVVGHGEISVPSTGPQHDERRLRFLYFPGSA